MSSTEAQAARRAPRLYRRAMPVNWWTRRGHYFWYVVREFTSLPLAVWLLWLLYDISRRQMVAESAFVVFSVVCLLFALYHSFTFLTLAGSIIHLKLFDRPVSPRLIVLSQFALWIGATAVIGFLLIWLSK